MESQKENNRKVLMIISLILNVSVVLMEIIGSIISAQNNGVALFQYYTDNSNMFTLVVCLIFSIYTARNLLQGKKQLPTWVKILKYMATCCLTVTFIVVLFILIPMGEEGSFHRMLFEKAGLYHHFLCPIVTIISFLVFDGKEPILSKNHVLFATIPTLLYAIITLTLNITKVMVGPYPFLHVYEQPIYMSLLWFIVIVGGAYLFAWIIRLANKQLAK